MNITIRRGEPADLEAALPLMYSSGPEVFEYLFTRGNKVVRDFLRYCWPQNNGLFGANAHYIAELDGNVVATMSIYDKREQAQWSNEVTVQAFKFFGLRILTMLPRLLRSSKWMVAPKSHELYLANFGVSPALRGQGIGEKMLNYAKDQAIEREKTVLCLDVAVTNPNAQRLYSRFGMSVTNTVDFPKANGQVPTSRRMEIPVKAATKT